MRRTRGRTTGRALAWLMALVVGSVGGGAALYAAVAKDFEVANSQYQAQEFEKARKGYLEIAKQGISEELFYNLGNANFRLGKLGEACLAYRRAELLNPRMAEATQNLRMLNQKLGFLKFDTSGIGSAVSKLTVSEWNTLAILGGWMAVLGGVTMRLYNPRQPLSGLVLGLAICGGMLVITGGVGAYLYRNHVDPSSISIVTGRDIVAVTGPYPGAQVVLNLPEGSEVKVIEERGRWRFVRIPGSTAGWVDQEAIEELWPFSIEP